MIYEIFTFEMLGDKKNVVLHTHKLIPFDKIIEIKKDYHGKIYEVVGVRNGEKITEKPVKLACASFSEKPLGLPSTTKFLPYRATVTEDNPGYLKIKAKVYENCVLMAETYGGYKQFYHESTKQVLRIAMNSHYYTPK